MHEITVNLDQLLWILGFFAAACTALVWLLKGSKPILRPFKEMREDLKALKERRVLCDQKFANDHEKLTEISSEIKMMMHAHMLTLKHIETGNCTGEVAKERKKLEDYLIDKD